jgi:hypothetical protein
MASNYNSRPLPSEALVRGDSFALIRKRQAWEDLVRDEVDALSPASVMPATTCAISRPA